MFLEIEKTKAKLEELDAAINYLNSDYYWKRRQELLSLILLLQQQDIAKFNSNLTT